MDRMTQKNSEGLPFVVETGKIHSTNGGYSGEAIDRLAQFENFVEDLLKKQAEFAVQLEKLRLEGKTKTVQFRQMFGNKVINANILMLLGRYGIF